MARIKLVWVTDGPQIEPILTIHRGHDGFVSFSRKTESGQWEELASVRADELASIFPAFRQELLRDSYYTVNAFWRANGKNLKWPKLGAPYRKTEGLRYLNACYVDLDCYKVGLNHLQVTGLLLSAQSKGYIPRVSIIARSGRGVWLFWLLQDRRNPRTPQRAFPEKVAIWSQIQRELHNRLAAYGADALDAARVTRVPDSTHGGSGKTVTYALQPDSRGQVCVYTLDSLARALNLTSLIDSGPAKRTGWIVLHRGRLRQFEQLRAMRGGFSEGCRNRGLLLYTIFMLKNGFCEDAVMENARKFGAECHPPLSEQEVRGAVTEANKAKHRRYRITNQTISDWLHIRPEEGIFLESLGPASSFHSGMVPAEKRPNRSERMRARRDSVKKIVAQSDRVPSAREMVTLLREQCSESASHVTVEADYRALGFISEAERKRRTHGRETARQLKIPKLSA